MMLSVNPADRDRNRNEVVDLPPEVVDQRMQQALNSLIKYDKIDIDVLDKERAAQLLTFISFGTAVTPDVFNQENVESLVLSVLSGGGVESIVEVQRQVCATIALLASFSGCTLKLVFGPGIEDRLFQLIRDPCCSPKLIPTLMDAVASIDHVSRGLRKRIFETELSELWLGNLMVKEDDLSFLDTACVAVSYFVSCASGKVDDKKLWDHFKSQFVPVIVDKCSTTINSYLLKSAAISLNMITEFAASSPERIDELVKAGCLRALFEMNLCCGHVFGYSFDSIEIILSVGDEVGDGRGRRGPKYNKYAKLVDKFEWGWDTLHPNNLEYLCSDLTNRAMELLEKYRPPIYDADGYDGYDVYDDDDDDDDDDEMVISEDDDEQP